ncbi:hypothetical protein B0H11DRAFT_1710444 [Mycena galericulata]|nr:hypothetical protein B0H11DRAFT_1710444 [Mycena galericulata]
MKIAKNFKISTYQRNFANKFQKLSGEVFPDARYVLLAYLDWRFVQTFIRSVVSNVFGLLKLTVGPQIHSRRRLHSSLKSWLADSYIFYNATAEEKASGLIPKPRGIGYGIGLACALFVMQGKRPLFFALSAHRIP